MHRPAIVCCAFILASACGPKHDTSVAPATVPAPTAEEPVVADAEPEPEPAPKDQRTLQHEQCEQGKAEMCTSVGVMWERGNEGPQDAAVARGYYDKGCTGGHELSCTYLAEMLAQGDGGPKDDARARKLWLAMCEQQPGEPCRRAGLSFEASGDEAHKTTARELYAKACQAEHTPACVDEARLMMLGDGGPKDPKAARAAFTNACDAGDPAGCFNLALALEKGLGGKKDKKGGALLRQQACEGGLQIACPAAKP